jgi:hypothetical protein
LFYVKEEYKDELISNFEFYLNNKVSFSDEDIELDYVLGLCINNGKKLFGVK